MKKVRMTIRFSEAIEKFLNNKSKETGLSKNALVVQALWEFVEKK